MIRKSTTHTLLRSISEECDVWGETWMCMVIGFYLTTKLLSFVFLSTLKMGINMLSFLYSFASASLRLRLPENKSQRHVDFLLRGGGGEVVDAWLSTGYTTALGSIIQKSRPLCNILWNYTEVGQNGIQVTAEGDLYMGSGPRDPHLGVCCWQVVFRVNLCFTCGKRSRWFCFPSLTGLGSLSYFH